MIVQIDMEGKRRYTRITRGGEGFIAFLLGHVNSIVTNRRPKGFPYPQREVWQETNMLRFYSGAGEM
jgi:hypothetical protein